MCFKVSSIVVLLFVNHACSRSMPRMEELDAAERELWRAAYDTPSAATSYETPAYHEDDDDDKLGKLDLLHDGLWALNAKIKELKAFDKALVASFLETKLKVKDLLENHMDVLKKHHHGKPQSYQYQSPSYSYQAPAYHAPAASYSAPAASYSAPAASYSAPAASYSAPATSYSAPAASYSAPAQSYQGHDPYYGH